MNKNMQNESKLKQIFCIFDHDENGYIEVPELRETIRGLNLTEQETQNLIKDFDIDGDGKISFEEFRKYFLCYLKQFLVKTSLNKIWLLTNPKNT